MDRWLQDLRHAVRALTSAPGATVFAALTFAAAIGGNMAFFSLINAWILRPLPYDEPDRLVVLREHRPAESGRRALVAAGDFLDWREQAGVFAGLAAYYTQLSDLTGISESEQIRTTRASANVFAVLGVRATSGGALWIESGRCRGCPLQAPCSRFRDPAASDDVPSRSSIATRRGTAARALERRHTRLLPRDGHSRRAGPPVRRGGRRRAAGRHRQRRLGPAPLRPRRPARRRHTVQRHGRSRDARHDCRRGRRRAAGWDGRRARARNLSSSWPGLLEPDDAGGADGTRRRTRRRAQSDLVGGSRPDGAADREASIGRLSLSACPRPARLR